MSEDEEFPSDEEEDEFYAAIGRAITGWAKIEDGLFRTTLVILGCSRERAAVVFYKTASFNARLSLTSDLIKTFFPRHEAGEQPHQGIKEWLALEKEMRSHLEVRNRLAHHEVGLVVDTLHVSDDDFEFTGIRQAVYPAHGERLRKRTEGMDELGIREIRLHIRAVSQLSNVLKNFRLQYVPSDIEQRLEQMNKATD